MKKLAQVSFWLGIACMPLSWLVWYVSPEIGGQVIGNVADPALRAVFREAHSERWGIYVGLWPVTLLVLSYILDKKSYKKS